jgi:hypothetical protein
MRRGIHEPREPSAGALPPTAATSKRNSVVSAETSLSSQILPNKSKQNGLDLLGFIRPNRDFSMGYGESK